MAVLATRVRFLQQQGYNAMLAVSSGVLISSASWTVKGALFLIVLPVAAGTLHLDESPISRGARIVRVLAIAIVVIGVASA